MLVLSRKKDQWFRIKVKDEIIDIVIVKIEGTNVRIGIEASREVEILRHELIDQDRPISIVNETAQQIAAIDQLDCDGEERRPLSRQTKRRE